MTRSIARLAWAAAFVASACFAEDARVNAMLAAPPSADIDELAYQAAFLRLAGAHASAEAVEGYAERTLLERILKKTPPAAAATLAEAIAATRDTPLTALRLEALDRSVVHVGGETFRNDAGVAIEDFEARLLTPTGGLYCRHKPPFPPIEPGVTVTLQCQIEKAETRRPVFIGSITYVPGGYTATSNNGILRDRRADVRKRLGDDTPGVITAAKASEMQVRADEHVLLLEIGLFAIAFVAGIPFGIWAKAPVVRALQIAGVVTLLVVAALALGYAFLGSTWSRQGDPMGLGLVIVVIGAMAGTMVAYTAWALLIGGVWLGILTGAALRKRPPA